MESRMLSEGIWQLVNAYDQSALDNVLTSLGFWRNKDDAIRGGLGPWHRKARAIVPQTYQHIKVTGLLLTIKDDVLGWTFEPYV